ncbi:MAG: hypothetical protein A2V77_19415 [Anaeromyxobacter sp. RBG_16_69_14]|nr:MAG: hypothetical protein A2V77_19415 [Anaeromyxobacter sp. RBG_16_69_14]
MIEIKPSGAIGRRWREASMSSLKIVTVALAVVSGATGWAMESHGSEDGSHGNRADLLSTWSLPDRDVDLLYTWSDPDESRDMLFTWWQPRENAALSFAFYSPIEDTGLAFTWSSADEARDMLFTWSHPLPAAEAEGSAGGEPRIP